MVHAITAALRALAHARSNTNHVAPDLRNASAETLRAAALEQGRRDSISQRAAIAGVRRSAIRTANDDAPSVSDIAGHYVDALLVLGAGPGPFPGNVYSLVNAMKQEGVGSAKENTRTARAERVMFHAMTIWSARGLS